MIVAGVRLSPRAVNCPTAYDQRYLSCVLKNRLTLSLAIGVAVVQFACSID